LIICLHAFNSVAIIIVISMSSPSPLGIKEAAEGTLTPKVSFVVYVTYCVPVIVLWFFSAVTIARFKNKKSREYYPLSLLQNRLSFWWYNTTRSAVQAYGAVFSWGGGWTDRHSAQLLMAWHFHCMCRYCAVRNCCNYSYCSYSCYGKYEEDCCCFH
jgi:hypothetical protein